MIGWDSCITGNSGKDEKDRILVRNRKSNGSRGWCYGTSCRHSIVPASGGVGFQDPTSISGLKK